MWEPNDAPKALMNTKLTRFHQAAAGVKILLLPKVKSERALKVLNVQRDLIHHGLIC